MTDTYNTDTPTLLLPSLLRADERAEIARVFNTDAYRDSADVVMGELLQDAILAPKIVLHDRHHTSEEADEVILHALELLNRGDFHLPHSTVWLEVYREDPHRRICLLVKEMTADDGRAVIRFCPFIYGDKLFAAAPWTHVNVIGELPLVGNCQRMQLWHEPGISEGAMEAVQYYMHGASTVLRYFILALAHPEVETLVETVPRQRSHRPTGPRYLPPYTVVTSPAEYRVTQPAEPPATMH